MNRPKLLIISNMPHYRTATGQLTGWGPTVGEINQLATLFSEVRHIGCLYPGAPPATSLPYDHPNISLVPLPPAGGEGWAEKWDLLKHVPLYLRTIGRHLGWADVVHVRCPANIPFLALILLMLSNGPARRWVKYAGDWQRNLSRHAIWALQRWMLRRNLIRGVVTINGEWPGQPVHVRTFFNPSLTAEDLDVGAQAAACKRLQMPLQLVSVGALREDKGTGTAIRVLAALLAAGADARLTVVGDGPDRPAYEQLRDRLGLTRQLHFAGWVPHTALAPYYRQAHILIFPSKAEGWPKVVSEAMAYGVVPVTSDISCIKQYLTRFGCGQALPPADVLGFARTLLEYCRHPDRWAAESQRGVEAAKQFTYDEYLRKVKAEVMELGGKAEITKAES
jgi:glycosyltransferase involved in cell wall biosynthesis